MAFHRPPLEFFQSYVRFSLDEPLTPLIRILCKLLTFNEKRRVLSENLPFQNKAKIQDLICKLLLDN
jgi:hypothetical protein